jgi:hypothetical protein
MRLFGLMIVIGMTISGAARAEDKLAKGLRAALDKAATTKN